MNTKEDYFDITLKLHEQSHIYWKTMIGVPLLMLGWSATQDGIDKVTAYLIVLAAFLIFILFAQAYRKFYILLRASISEYKLRAKDSKGPFIEAVNRLKLLEPWHLIVAGGIFTLISCASVLWKAYQTSINL